MVSARAVEHDDRDGRRPADRAADLQPVEPRQHDVEQDEVEAAGARTVEAFAAVGGRLDREAGVAKADGGDFADGRVVLDEQDPGVHSTLVAVRRAADLAAVCQPVSRPGIEVAAFSRARRSAWIGTSRARPGRTHRHQPEHERHAGRFAHLLDDHAIERDPERSHPEGEREVDGVRGVADGRRGDVREQGLELRALGEREQAHHDDPDPQPQHRRARHQEDDEPGGPAEVHPDDERLAADPVR